MKKITIPVLVLFVILVGLTLVKNGIAKCAVEKICRKVTGLELKISALDLSLLRSSIDIRNLRLMNPPSFPDRVMFDVPEIYGKIDVPTIFGSPIHVNEIRLDVREILVSKNKDGQLNLDALKPPAKKAPEERPSGEKSEADAKKAPPQIHIDRLVLKVGKVVYKDYSSGGEPTVREFELNLNETHENITNIQAIVPIILKRAVMNSAVASLVKLDMNKILSEFDVSNIDFKAIGLGELEGAAKLLSQGASKTGEGAGSAADQAADAAKGLFNAFVGSEEEKPKQ